jgi:hypothetical protein
MKRSTFLKFLFALPLVASARMYQGPPPNDPKPIGPEPKPSAPWWKRIFGGTENEAPEQQFESQYQQSFYPKYEWVVGPRVSNWFESCEAAGFAPLIWGQARKLEDGKIINFAKMTASSTMRDDLAKAEIRFPRAKDWKEDGFFAMGQPPREEDFG